MKKERKEKEYHKSKIGSIFQTIIAIIRENPELLKEENQERLIATVKYNIPELKDKSKCANCGASMIEYIFEFDCLDALLLVEMAKEVRKRLGVGLSFTVANQIRIQHLSLASYAMKSRTTQMSKLGLVAKLIGENGRQVPGTWVITKRGWNALRGEKVPKSVQVWRNSIEERGEEFVTITDAFNNHRTKVEQIIKKNKAPKTDYRKLFDDYDPEEWYKIGAMHEGVLF